MDERRDFGEFYPGGGAASYSPPASNVAGDVAALKARVDAVGAAAGALAELDPDGPESLAEVKELVNGVRSALVP